MRTPITETRDSLLIRIRNEQDRDAWSEFVGIYRPLLYRIARQRGLQDADARDVAQRVLLTVTDRIGEWELGQATGSFRKWLNRTTTNAAIDAIRKSCRHAMHNGSVHCHLLKSHSVERDLQQEDIEAEYRRSVFRWAARRIKGEFQDAPWQAFWLTTVGDQTAAAAATQLGQSTGAVYTARSRIMRRLKEVVENYESQ